MEINTSNLRETIPKNILEIRYTSDRLGVFALKTIPKNVIFGPFTGLKPVRYKKEHIWRIKSGKLISPRRQIYLNWMEYVNCAATILNQNLSIFQHKNQLYFRSKQEIYEGDELLIYFGVEEAENSIRGKVTNYRAVIEEKFDYVYGCTYCCLGFNAYLHLFEHKMKCTYQSNYEKDEGL